jgi:hypothetical protein
MKIYQNLQEAPPQVSMPYKHAINDVQDVGFNPAQLHFLQLLSYIKTEEALMDLKRLVRDFYAQQLQKEADNYWADGTISDNLLNEHLRTPYK